MQAKNLTTIPSIVLLAMAPTQTMKKDSIHKLVNKLMTNHLSSTTGKTSGALKKQVNNTERKLCKFKNMKKIFRHPNVDIYIYIIQSWSFGSCVSYLVLYG